MLQCFFFYKFADEISSLSKGPVLNLIMYIESAKAYLNLREILEMAVQLSKNGKFVPSSLVFGSDDFCASIGIEIIFEYSSFTTFVFRCY